MTGCAERPDCVIPLLHGEAGEDGALREILDWPVSPTSARPRPPPARLRQADRQAGRARAGIRTPDSVALPADTFRELGAAAVLDAVVDQLGLPLVVKPAKGGSALGFSVVRTASELPSAMVGVLRVRPGRADRAVVEGIEVAVPVVDLDGTSRALPAVEIRPTGASTTTPPATPRARPSSSYRPRLDPTSPRECARVAETAHRALGLRDCRV